jgi:GT2 family glycosyltransferase
MTAAHQAGLTVIIVNWNTRDLLRRCLDSLQADAGPLVLQVIVVDNGSRDGSQKLLRSAYPWVTRIENTANVGFARANNQGAALACAPLLLLLNSDAAMVPGGLWTAVHVMHEHPTVGVAGLQLLNDDRTLQPSGKRFPTLLSTIVGLLPVPEQWRGAYDRRRNARDYARMASVDEVSAAAMVVRRDLFHALGGFDESFHFFGEDIDLCWRARKAGYAVVYLPSAQVIHWWGGARTRTPSIRQGLLSQRAQYMLLQRHKPAWQVALLHGFLIGFTAARLVRAVAQILRRHAPVPCSIAHLYARELLWLLRH